MAELSDVKWKEFSLTEIFPIIKRGKRLKKSDHLSGAIPYVSSTATSNGVDGFIGNQGRVRVFNNCLTVANSGSVGSTFYHSYQFIASDHVTQLKREGLDKYAYLFLAPLVQRLSEKYSFNREINDDRLKREKLIIPVNEHGEMDFEFMSKYMREIEIRTLKPIINKLCIRLIHNEISGGGGNSIHPNWKPFPLSEIFTILPGKRLTKSDMTEGLRPFIGASDSNNGVTAWVNNTNESLDSNVLGVNYNGSVCETFFHPYECIFSDDVKRLHLKSGVDSKYIMLFLKTIILQQKCKYEYGYKFNEQRMLRQTILLPVDSSGNPDWHFMEMFMRKLETQMLETTIEIFKNRINVNKCKWGVKWKPISLKSLFHFTKGNQNHMSSLCDGSIPLVSARKVENGYKGFITPNNKELFEGNIITLNLDGDGGAGIAYYQPSKMALDSHVGALSPRRKMTRYQMLFISRCITNQGDMFGHGYSINGNRIKSMKIMLPVDDGDEINWELMDEYMQGVECTQIMSYLEYAKSQLTRNDS